MDDDEIIKKYQINAIETNYRFSEVNIPIVKKFMGEARADERAKVIKDAEIDKMDFQKASDKLNDLITRAKQRSPNYTSSTSPKVAGEPQARGNEPANASDFKRLTDTIKEFYGDASSNTKKEMM